jgi:hypothetical protein
MSLSLSWKKGGIFLRPGLNIVKWNFKSIVAFFAFIEGRQFIIIDRHQNTDAFGTLEKPDAHFGGCDFQALFNPSLFDVMD